jgi:glycosyltransferase involved in cell wall biosynthesis
MISVIIPVYNVEEYLDKCIESVLTNTYKDLEVICVNDGSTDGSPEILQKWKERDSRIIVVDQENRGLPEARNSGLEVMTGDYTAFIDSDDWVHPNYFQAMLDCMEKTDADMVVSEVREFKPDESVEVADISEYKSHELSENEFYRHLFARRMIWGRLLRKRDTHNLRFPPEVDAHQDSLYNLKLIAHIKHPKVYMIDDPMYYYLKRPGSLFKRRSYAEMIQIADWYVKNEQDPHHENSGEWSELLLFHSIETVLNCRYQAKQQGNRELIVHTNALLRSLVKCMLKDKTISVRHKGANVVLAIFPFLYRYYARLVPMLYPYRR